MIADLLYLIPWPTSVPCLIFIWLLSVWLLHQEFLYLELSQEQRNVTIVEYPTWLGRWISRLKYLWAGPYITLRAYETDIPFALNTPETCYVHLSSEAHVKQLEKAPEEHLSLHALSKDMFQPKYTMNGLEVQDKMNSNGSLHTRVLRVVLQSHLSDLHVPLSKVIARTFSQQLLLQKKSTPLFDSAEYTSLPIFQLAKTVITSANALAFFGDHLSSNTEFLSAAQSYPEDLLATAEILRFTPWFITPLLAPIFMRNHRASKTLVHYLMPVVEQRLSLKWHQLERGTRDEIRMRKECRAGGGKACDIIQFFVDATTQNHQKESSSHSWSAEKIVQVILGIWFAAVHQPAISIVYALQDLLDHPEYLAPLRHELSSISPHSADSLEHLPLLDSFLKESSRLHPSDAISVRRKVLEPFTFSDGAHLRVGDVACVPSQAIMRDQAHYGTNSLVFDAFRFVSSDGENVSRFADASPTFPLWGLGRHSCPGRYYASHVLKIFLSHLIMNYDIQQSKDQGPPPFFGTRRSFYFRSAIVPRSGTSFLFRKRREGKMDG